MYCPGENWLASNVALALTVPADELPFERYAVPRTVPAELKVMRPVAGAPLLVAATVAVRTNDVAVCCEVRVVLVAICPSEKVTGVRFELELKLLSP